MIICAPKQCFWFKPWPNIEWTDYIKSPETCIPTEWGKVGASPCKNLGSESLHQLYPSTNHQLCFKPWWHFTQLSPSCTPTEAFNIILSSNSSSADWPLYRLCKTQRSWMSFFSFYLFIFFPGEAIWCNHKVWFVSAIKPPSCS